MDVYVGCYLKVPKVNVARSITAHRCSNKQCALKLPRNARFCAECGGAAETPVELTEGLDFPPTNLGHRPWTDFVFSVAISADEEVWVGNRRGSPALSFSYDEGGATAVRVDAVDELKAQGRQYYGEFMEAFREAYGAELVLEYGVVVNR